MLAERLTPLPDSNRRTGFGIMQAAGKVIGGGRQLSSPSMLLRPQCRLDATIETSPASEIAARLVLSLKKISIIDIRMRPYKSKPHTGPGAVPVPWYSRLRGLPERWIIR